MLVVDTSVLVSINVNEPNKEHFEQILFAAETVYVGWPTLIETWTVLAPRLSSALADRILADLLSPGGLIAVDFDGQHFRLACDGYKRFRLGGHPARLNLGDAMSYALAKAMDLTLLFKGMDFGLTDVKVHLGSVLA